MEAIEAMITRRSVRAYKDISVPHDLLEKAIDTARYAPTARNIQPWEFVVVTNPTTLSTLGLTTDHGRFLATAPAAIVVVCQDTKYYLEDGVAAVINILTALHDLGLGACWIAGDKKPYAANILELLHAPKNSKLIALIACGFPADDAPRPSKLPLKQLLHWDQFD